MDGCGGEIQGTWPLQICVPHGHCRLPLATLLSHSLFLMQMQSQHSEIEYSHGHACIWHPPYPPYQLYYLFAFVILCINLLPDDLCSGTLYIRI
jgi:hypothetical protein